MIIVFEGLEGAGKQTQIDLLRGFKRFAYPSKTFSILRDFLNKKVELNRRSLFFLFLSDILNEQEQIIKQDSVLDRYIFSTIAYDTTFPFEDKLKIIDIAKPVAPDIVFYLDIDPELGVKRKLAQNGTLDRYEENLSFLKEVKNNYERLLELNYLAKRWIRIDATKSIEEISKEISEAIASI